MAESRQLKLYNSLSRESERLSSDRDIFGFYCCGPTVYSRAHIGNFRTFVCADLLVRTLRAFGYPLKFVMNLTDVDDKTIRGACQEKVSLAEFTKKHEESYWKDREALSISKPDIEPRATGHIAEMIRLVEKLVAANHAYLADDGSVYYRIGSFPSYGCLCHLDREGLRVGARVAQDEYEKESLADFVLWKKHRSEDGDVKWDSPWGPGRPGWHLECSAMSMKYLGESYELHGGGVDLLFPHHENEIAQSEGATGKPFVKHWWHVAHLLVDGRKMSKSLGNLYTLEDVEKKGFTGRELRYALMSANYRENLNFTWESLEAARSSLDRLDNLSIRLHGFLGSRVAEQVDPTPMRELIGRVHEALGDDLNISAALAVLFVQATKLNTLLDQKKLSLGETYGWIQALEELDKMFAINLGMVVSGEGAEFENAQVVLLNRQAARDRKDWVEADKLRQRLIDLGFDVKDTPQGQQLTPRRR